MYRLSVSAGTVLQNLPFEQRVREIAQAGFLVDFWGSDESAIDRIAADPNIEVNAIPGSMGGSMVHPDGVELFMDGVEKCLDLAGRVNCRNLCLLTGEFGENGNVVHPIAAHPATMWITAYKTLCQVAELAEKHDTVYHVEQLNIKVDHAGYPFPNTADVTNLLDEVGSPRIKLLCDLYHMQIQQGNVIQTVRDYYDYIGNLHVADVPGRHEPGTGEMNYPGIVRVLRELNYNGVIGLEAFPKGDDIEAMTRFRDIFS